MHPRFRLNGQELSNNFTFSDLRNVLDGNSDQVAIIDFLKEWTSSSPTIQVKTSGSTGRPKTISLKKEHMLNSALATGRFFGLEEANKALLCLPTSYIAGKMMLVRAMVLGLDLHCVSPSQKPLTDTKYEYGFAAMTPMQVGNSLSFLDQVQTLIIGGAAVSKELTRELSILSRCQCFETYGMTETITHIAVKKLNHSSNDIPESSFQVLPKVIIKTDERGCLVINAPKISDSEIVTNDLVEISRPNSFVWLGRFDNVINSGGIKLIPEVIEQKLAAVIDVPFFVFGLRDIQLGEKLTLVVEGHKIEKDITQKIEGLSNLGKYEKPKEVFLLDRLERTPNGKIDRKKTIERIQRTS